MIVFNHCFLPVSGGCSNKHQSFDMATEPVLYFEGRIKPTNLRKCPMIILTTHLHCYEKWKHIYKERINTATAAKAKGDCCEKKAECQFLAPNFNLYYHVQKKRNKIIIMQQCITLALYHGCTSLCHFVYLTYTFFFTHIVLQVILELNCQ